MGNEESNLCDTEEADDGTVVETPTLTEEVNDALSQLASSSITVGDALPSETQEKQVVTDFMRSGCGCKLWQGNCCSEQFSQSYVESARLNCFGLSNTELDMVILGQIMANSNLSPTTSTVSRNAPSPRQKKYTKYFHEGSAICLPMFRFLHGIGAMRLKNLVKHYKQNGLVPRTHGNIKRLPSNTLSFTAIENVIRFLLNYSDQHGLLLPGRIPGYSRSDIKLLPSSLSKRKLWQIYHQATIDTDNVHAAAYSTFCILWRKLLPSIIIMKPMTDLCWECQKKQRCNYSSCKFSVS